MTLIEFDQTTMARMTAALEYVCRKIPTERDCQETRKRIAERIVSCARTGKRSQEDLQEAGLEALAAIVQPARRGWFDLIRRKQ
jgi:hypothetical protein